MKPSLALNAITSAFNYNLSGIPRQRAINLFLRGAPGVSKSSLIYQAADALGVEVAEYRLAGMDAADMRGVPKVEGKKTIWCTPEDIPTDPKWKGFIFFDEIVQAAQIVQSSVSQIVLEGRMGTVVLPAGAVIVAAGNRRSDRSAVNEMPRHLANRFTFIDVEADVDDFATWANTNDVRGEVVSFVRSRTELLHKFDAAETCFPSPRAWAFVSGILDMQGLDPYVQQCMFAGTVGEGAAIEFMGHLRLYGQMPSVEEIIASPSKARIPDGEHAPAMSYAVASNLSRAINTKNAKAIVEYLGRLPNEEFAVLCIKDAIARDADTKKIPEVRAWAAKNASLII